MRNDGAVRAGELLLLDAGVETDTLYTADVTRTLPIGGEFDELQRKIYEAVFDAQEAGIAAVRPGARYRDFHAAAQRVLAERLWSGACSRARRDASSSSACSAATRCTAPATCSASTSTTAPTPAPRTT